MKKLKLIIFGLVFYSLLYAVDKVTIPSNHPLIEYTGRIDFANPLAPKFSYSGVSVRASFQGTSISILLNDAGNQNYYNIILDHGVLPRLNTIGGLKQYDIATDLKDTIHEIEIFKLTEGSFGKTEFSGFILNKGNTLTELSNQRTRLIEYIGNSITCGYGNEGVNGGVFLPNTQNHYLTYAAITSRSFNARHLAVCKSGIGIYRNYNGPVTGNLDCMTNYYQRIFIYDALPLYSFIQKPDLVCIDLGTNDFSTSKGDSALFVDKYLQLIDTIQKHNDAVVLCVIGPMLWGTILTNVRKYVNVVVNKANIKNNGKVCFFEMSQQTGSLGIGVDSHPTVAQHLKNAKELINCIDTLMNWQISPQLISGSTIVRNEVNLEFNTEMQDLTGNYEGFTVKENDENIPVSSVVTDLADKSKIRLYLSGNLKAGSKITVMYTPGSITGKNNIKLEGISSTIINNNLIETGITENRTDEFLLYPNPFPDKKLNYKMSVPDGIPVIADLYNFKGQLIISRNLNKSMGVIDYSKDNIKNGSYILKFTIAKRQYIKKIVL